MNFISFKIAMPVFIRYMAFLWLLSYPAELKAQQHDFFSVNDRNINVPELNKKIAKMMADVGVPALSLAVIANNKIVFFNTYGYKSLSKKKKVNNRTIFEAASLSKSFLVYVVNKLVDEGKLDLDKPMYQYIKNSDLEHDPRYKLITPRMILSHCSGIENWKWENNKDSLEIISNPGEQFVYSGEGYQYLAQVVSRILNEPYKKYINQQVLTPLKLKRVYTAYKWKGLFPANYVVGHNSMGKEVKKWKNLNPVPASGIHLTAKEYANLIIAFFDHKHLSSNRVKDLLQPIVRISENNPHLYYGPGFEILFSGGDTIIAHGGDNPGVKALMFYSMVSKNGFVFLTNGDRGKLMASQLSEMTAALKVQPMFDDAFYAQYPSYAIDLLKIYKENGSDQMFKRIEELREEHKGAIGINTLNELGYLFFGDNKTIAKQLIEYNTKLYPESSAAFYLLGQLDMEQGEYKQAYEHLLKAKELHFNLAPLDQDILKCKEEMSRK